MQNSSYRRTFSGPVSAAAYDERVYARGTAAEILWRIEAGIVRDLAEEVIRGRSNASYLDFACGTGRILSLLEDLAPAAVGIDVSPSMLERANEKLNHAKLICKDITAQGDEIESQYDLITSFRFLTNAENELRRSALKSLWLRLKDDGVLIVNTHGNPLSYRALLLPYHWAKDAACGHRLFGYLSNRKANRILEEAGFTVQKIIGMGFVPQKLMGLCSEAVVERIERFLAGKLFLQSFGLNQIFVCTKRKAG